MPIITFRVTTKIRIKLPNYQKGGKWNDQKADRKGEKIELLRQIDKMNFKPKHVSNYMDINE